MCLHFQNGETDKNYDEWYGGKKGSSQGALVNYMNDLSEEKSGGGQKAKAKKIPLRKRENQIQTQD